VLTSDEIASAVLEYAGVLSHEGRSDIVDVPAVLPSGTVGTATLLIGPSSQLASVTEESDLPSPDDVGLVADLHMRGHRLDHSAPEAHRYAVYLASPEEYE
jgi:hypothetical protein